MRWITNNIFIYHFNVENCASEFHFALEGMWQILNALNILTNTVFFQFNSYSWWAVKRDGRVGKKIYLGFAS